MKRHNILILEDDIYLSKMTEIGFRRYDKNRFNILKAYNLEDAKEITIKNKISLAIVDVVLETEKTGLQYIQFLRDDIKLKKTRIVIRTGEISFLTTHSEMSVEEIRETYDIDHFLIKDEITPKNWYQTIEGSISKYNELNTRKNTKVTRK